MKKFCKIALFSFVAILGYGSFTYAETLDLSNPSFPVTANGNSYTEMTWYHSTSTNLYFVTLWNNTSGYRSAGGGDCVNSLAGTAIGTSLLQSGINSDGSITICFNFTDNIEYTGSSLTAVDIQSSSGGGTIFLSGANSPDAYFSTRCIVTYGCSGPILPDNTTHFTYIYPSNGSLIATTSPTTVGDDNFQGACVLNDCSNGQGYATTTMTWEGYVAPVDFVASSTFISATIAVTTGTGFVGNSTYLIPVTSSGVFSYSTTSKPLYGGGNRLDSHIINRVPVSGWISDFSCWITGECASTVNNLVSSTTIFTLGSISITPAQTLFLKNFGTQQGITDQLKSYASTTDQLLRSCNPFNNFDISQCVSGLIIPADEDVTSSLNSIKGNIMSRAPFGWIVRISTLIATTSTTTIPSISYTFQSDSPLAGDTLSFDVSSYMSQASALSGEMTSNMPDHKTVWEILQTPINMFLYIFLVYVMITDITGINFHSGGRKEVDNNRLN